MAPIASAITRVLVTGFGPFGGVPNNPSWVIAQRLPTTLPNNIEIIVHPSYVPVAFHPVIDIVPKLIAQHQPDIALHMGIAAGRTYFAVEQTAAKDGYQWARDVDGKSFTEAEIQAIWGDQPERLSTDLDLNAVVASWKNGTSDVKWPQDLGRASTSSSDFQTLEGPVQVELLEDVIDTKDVKWSDAVGTYLCGFIYYTSLVEAGRNGKRKLRDVAFMHVPSLNNEEQLNVGVEVTIELVQALVQTFRAQRGL